MSAEGDAAQTLAQFNAMLVEAGYATKALDLGLLDQAQAKPLSDALHGLLAQRQRDADLRHELVGRNRTLESALERTKKLWQEDGDKCAEAERRLEGAKSAATTAQHQLEQANATLRKNREELHRSRKDLISVKQQATQQRQSNERHVERLRARFTEEAVKALRTSFPSVELAAGPSTLDRTKEKGDASALQLMTRLARRQLDELERRGRSMSNDNLALKRFAFDCLNLARTAGSHLIELQHESDSHNPTEPRRLATVTQNDIFPPGAVLDAAESPARVKLAETSDSVTRSITALRQGRMSRMKMTGEAVRQRLRDSVTDAPRADDGQVLEMDCDTSKREALEQVEALQAMLDRAMIQIESLEQENMRRKEDPERGESDERAAAMDVKSLRELQDATAEVERQRQRYQSLCRALEEQEQALVQERQELQRRQEELALEQSLLAIEGSLSASQDEAEQGEQGHIAPVDDDSNASNVTLTSAVRQPQSRLIPQRFASTPRTRIMPMMSVAAKTSTTTTTKRALTDDKENAAAITGAGEVKRQRTASKDEETGTHVIGGSEMRFITMRKNRGGGR